MQAFFGQRAEDRRLALGIVAIVVLLIVDAVLVGLALRAQQGPGTPPSGAPAPVLSQSPGQTLAPPAADPSASGAPGGAASRLLAVATDGVAWRAEVGGCDEPGTFEVTADGGSTWAEAGLAVDGPMLALQPNADGVRGLAVVGDAECEPVVHRTFTAAVGWEIAPEQRAGSYLAPDGSVVLGGAETEAPCDGVSAVTASGGGVVLCGDVAQARTGDGAWVPIAEGVVAVGPVEGGVAVALRGIDGCDGLAVGTVVGGALQTACTDISADAPVAVAATGGRVWVWAGDELAVVAL